jgi:hypothetical protein
VEVEGEVEGEAEAEADAGVDAETEAEAEVEAEVELIVRSALSSCSPDSRLRFVAQVPGQVCPTMAPPAVGSVMGPQTPWGPMRGLGPMAPCARWAPWGPWAPPGGSMGSTPCHGPTSLAQPHLLTILVAGGDCKRHFPNSCVCSGVGVGRPDKQQNQKNTQNK